LPEVYIALEEAAEYEGTKYNTFIQRIQRTPQAFKTRTEPATNGGKDRVLVALSSLSKKARRAHKEAQSIEGRDVVIGERTTDGVPWYVDVDLNWYIENHGNQYYQAVEFTKTIQEFLNYADENRTEFAQEFASLKGISQRTLYRQTESYLEASAWAMKLGKEDGKNYDFYKVLALCRKPKQRFTFPSLTDRVKAFIENLWFDKEFAANNGTIEMLYEKMKEVGSNNGWEYPSYQTVARYINYLMEEKRYKNTRFLAANGVKEYRNKVMVKASRDSKALPVMGVVQGDVHTFDCWVKYTYPNGTVQAIRPNLVAWMDVKSRVIVSDLMCLHANAQIMKHSIFKMIYNEICGRPCGVPFCIYIDNGKEYTAETLTGRPRKERVSFDSETVGFYKSIGIQDDIRALPYWSWSKSYIERHFGTVCSEFTKWMASYTGTLTGSRTAAKIKKDVSAMLERDELLTLEEFYELWQKWLQEKYHQKEHGGLKKMKEEWLKPAELFANAEERYYKPAPPKSYATMLMMKADRVSVYNIGIRKFGYEYRADELCDYINDKVDIRWEPEDVTRLYVYARDGKKICEALSQELLLIAPKVPQKALEDHMKAQRNQLKRDRERLKEYTTPFHERIDQHVNAPSDTVGGFIVKKEGKKPVDNVVALPGDKQFREEVRTKKQTTTQGDNEFYQKKAERALEILRKLG